MTRSRRRGPGGRSYGQEGAEKIMVGVGGWALLEYQNTSGLSDDSMDCRGLLRLLVCTIKSASCTACLGRCPAASASLGPRLPLVVVLDRLLCSSEVRCGDVRPRC